MWRVLEVGELIKDGDQYFPNGGGWEDVLCYAGNTVQETDVPYRRKISQDFISENFTHNKKDTFQLLTKISAAVAINGNILITKDCVILKQINVVLAQENHI